MTPLLGDDDETTTYGRGKMDAHPLHGSTTQALPLRQQPLPSKWASDNNQLTTPPPDAVSTSNSTGTTDWEAHKHIINHLYMDQNLNLNEVVERMKEHGFHAT